MPLQSFFTTTTANEGKKKCCNFDLLKNEYKQNVIEQQTRSSKSDSCMHSNHKNHANNNDHKSIENERTEQEAGKQGKGKSARAESGRAESGRAVLTGSNWGYGVRRCDGNSDSVSVNANCFPHALRFRDCTCTCHSLIDPRVGNTDPDMPCQPESSSLNGYMVFGVCLMP